MVNIAKCDFGEPVRKAVVYARVSSKEQEKEGFSIPAQLKLLRDYAAAHGMVVAKEYVDVETAKRTGRTAFGEMIAHLKTQPSIRVTAFLDEEKKKAEKTLLALTPQQPASVLYDKLWPQVLARHVVRKSDVNAIAARLRDSDDLIFPDWQRGRRVPHAHYRTQRK